MPEAVKKYTQPVLIAVIAALIPTLFSALYLIPRINDHLADPHPTDVRLTLRTFEVMAHVQTQTLAEVREEQKMMRQELVSIHRALNALKVEFLHGGGK